MNASQLRALGFDEAADEAEAKQWQGEKARVYVEHQRKNPDERAGYIVGPAVQMWGWMGDDTITTGQIAELETRTAETANDMEDSR